MRLMPPSSCPVQLTHSPWPFAYKASAEQVSKQVVVAPPPAHVVKRYQKELGPLELLQ
jgi:hypothetical protein